jgi:ABC-type sulfate/molybdate transport systems ATPase subunit
MVSSQFVGTSHERSNQRHNGWIRRNETPNIKFHEHRSSTVLHVVTEPRYSTAQLCAGHQSFFVRDCSAAVSVADDKETSSGVKCVHIKMWNVCTSHWNVCTSKCETCAHHTEMCAHHTEMCAHQNVNISTSHCEMCAYQNVKCVHITLKCVYIKM